MIFENSTYGIALINDVEKLDLHHVNSNSRKKQTKKRNKNFNSSNNCTFARIVVISTRTDYNNIQTDKLSIIISAPDGLYYITRLYAESTVTLQFKIYCNKTNWSTYSINK